MRVVAFKTSVKMSQEETNDLERVRKFIADRYIPWLSERSWARRYHMYATLSVIRKLDTNSVTYYVVVSYVGRVDKHDHNTLCHVLFKRVAGEEVWCLSTGLLSNTLLFDSEDDLFDAATQNPNRGNVWTKTITIDPNNTGAIAYEE